MNLSDETSVGHLDDLRASHAMFRSLVRGLSLDAPAGPSLLPGWSRAELITHLCRNADGMSGMLEGALNGQIVAMYPEGMDKRNADIAAGRGATLGDLIDDMAGSFARLEALWDRMDDQAWERPVQWRQIEGPAWATIRMRWQEVEVHAVDMDVGRGLEALPEALADELARIAVESVPSRLDSQGAGIEVRHPGLPGGYRRFGSGSDLTVVDGVPAQILAWLLGRHAGKLVTTIAGRPCHPPVLGSWI
ncbi:MAG: maleylpyruvate isomerase family mycothiol-dependent enzyme [Acidimicrobiaceae bacterium]|nr:maleylpyruvate isomerase family mycothiol-dependent enzyme [Acidimicrobiaceae bacterium]